MLVCWRALGEACSHNSLALNTLILFALTCLRGHPPPMLGLKDSFKHFADLNALHILEALQLSLANISFSSCQAARPIHRTLGPW